MAKNKRQHFVPQSYLKAWCDPAAPASRTPYVWIFDKDGSNPRKKAPQNIFYEKDMYTMVGVSGERDLVIEHGLGQLENDFVLVRESRLSKRLPLDSRERATVCAFVAAMHARTKLNREHLRNMWKRPLEQMERLRKQRNASSEEESGRLAASLKPVDPGRTEFYYEDVKEFVETPL